MANIPKQVVIDSTKDSVRMLEQWQNAASYPATLRAIHISKSPIEQVGELLQASGLAATASITA